MATDTTTLLERVQEQEGWEVRQTNGGHFALRGPDGQLIHTAKTPSDSRGLNNTEARLRRAGFGDVLDGPPDRRAVRVARGDTKMSQVLTALQEAPGQPFDAPTLAVKLGLEAKQISTAFYWLKTHHPEVVQLDRGHYFYLPSDDEELAAALEVLDPPRPNTVPVEPPSLVARKPGVWCTCGRWFRTEGFRNNHARQKDGPGHEETLTTMPESARDFTNGNREKRTDSEKALRQAAATTSVVATQAVVTPIKVVPSALPKDLPAMFEAVSTDRKGNLVLRDENGDHWLAVPMRPIL